MLIFTNLPVVVPPGADLAHPVRSVRVVGLGPLRVLESAAADGADADEEQHHDDVEHGQLVPAPPNVLHHACLARVTPVAQHLGCIVPPIAVGVLGCRGRRVVVA